MNYSGDALFYAQIYMYTRNVLSYRKNANSPILSDSVCELRIRHRIDHGIDIKFSRGERLVEEKAARE